MSVLAVDGCAEGCFGNVPREVLAKDISQMMTIPAQPSAKSSIIFDDSYIFYSSIEDSRILIDDKHLSTKNPDRALTRSGLWDGGQV